MLELIDQVPPAGGQLLDYGCRYVEFKNGQKISTTNWIYIHKMTGDADLLATYLDKPVISAMTCGRAKVIVAGIDVDYSDYISLSLWHDFFKEHMGIHPNLDIEKYYYHGQLIKAKDCWFLSLFNLTGYRGPVHVSVDLLNDLKLELPVELSPHESRVLVLDKKLTATKKILYSTSELEAIDKKPYAFKAYGSSESLGQIAFNEATTIKIKGKPYSSSKCRNGLHKVDYEHKRAGLILEIMG
jgi:hypothetical protein